MAKKIVDLLGFDPFNVFYTIEKRGLGGSLEEKKIDFCELISSHFIKFLRSLKIFQLRNLLGFIIELLQKYQKKGFNWPVFDRSYISVRYKKLTKVVFDYRLDKSNRYQSVLYKPSDCENFAKQKSAAMANFIHSIDAHIMFLVLRDFDSDIVPIHDCWGVPSSKIDCLRDLVRQDYSLIVDDYSLYNYTINYFRKFLKDSVSDEACASFEKFLHKGGYLSTLKASDLANAKNFIFYG